MSIIKITPRENGPLSMLNDGEQEDLIGNSKGEIIPNKSEINLCRCGSSNNKPFCDGSHMNIGFSSKKETDGQNNKRKNYQGKEITIHDNRGICSHSGICTDGLKKVFKMGEEPWIDPDGASAQEIIDAVERCPSGALSYSVNGVEHKDGVGNREDKTKIFISKNGPIVIKGEVELVGVEFGDEASKEHYTLCRCGSSKNKPFCDGAHWNVKFLDDEN